MPSKFYDIPGAHKPLTSSSGDSSSLLGLQRKQSLTYFSYQAIEQGKKTSSKHDPANPNKHKLGTYDGVFVPTALNVLSILMFLRFGFILGQLGLLCSLGLLLLSYLIDLLTTLSISAISTNGVVRGGGAYYMISRSLGPEFGGSIGLVFFLGQVLNSGMNAAGLVEPLLYNFGESIPSEPEAALFSLLPRGYYYELFYSTIILAFCLLIALVGSHMVSRAGNMLFFILVASILSIPVSVILQDAFIEGNVIYTGPSFKTLYDNLLPHFTKGAAGSIAKGKETFSSLFGIFFPATAGIFAGAGMSSELRKPSKSIAKGTLWGLLFTFICYAIVVLSMACSIPRESLQKEVQIIQSVSVIQWLIFLGEASTSLFSVIVGMVGAAYVLEAISKDKIIPGISIFYRKPLWGLLFTWTLTQACLFMDVNKIASFITMTFLITFTVMNLACFLLRVSSAPNFRPSFKYFGRTTALTGGLLSILAMFVVDMVAAFAVILGMMIVFIFIHYFCPPKPWGDVSQSLIYHQVRKYLLRLRQDNIKYWRPQILLFVDHPRTSWNLIRFCNHLKKGGLYVLGHVAVADDFQNHFEELQKQQKAWVKIRDLANIKAFVQIGIGPNLLWGIRNVFLGCGLGGMKPNISIIGFFDLEGYYAKSHQESTTNSPVAGSLLNNSCLNLPNLSFPLPTDDCKSNEKIDITQWVHMLEDLSVMKSNIGVARGFSKLKVPDRQERKHQKKFIDLYPIQMSAEMKLSENGRSVVTTNFDTYTLILQLGAILVTVPQWKHTHVLRVILFVESKEERSAEEASMRRLLETLRINAEVLVVSLDAFRVYNTITNGDPLYFDYVNCILQDDKWWKDLIKSRKTMKPKRRFSTTSVATKGVEIVSRVPKYNVANLQKMGVSLTMTSNMPREAKLASYGSDDSEDENELASIYDAATSVPSTVQRLQYESVRKKNGPNKAVTPNKNLKRTISPQSLHPVFSSTNLLRTNMLEDAIANEPGLDPFANAPTSNTKTEEVARPLSPCASESSLIAAMNNLKFDDLPSRAQYLILNDMMTQVSRNSDLIFSSLPIPPLGTHKDQKESLAYVQDLDVWLEGLPSTLLINSQTMTVTTAL